MATEGLNINYQGLRESANIFRKEVSRMSSALSDAKTEIGNTTKDWQSTAAQTLRDRFESLAGKFDDFYNAIENYAKFLDNTANAYEAADKKIEQRADELLNSDYNA